MGQTKLPKAQDLIINSDGFGLLRKALIENLGHQKAKKFLIQFGSQLGSSKAKEIMRESNDLDELLMAAPKIHTQLQHVSNVEIFGSTRSFLTGESTDQDITGIWHDSFEVALHTANHGKASECTCHTLCGFASGFLSTIHGLAIYVYEETCRAKGDAQCLFHIKTREECERLQIDVDVYDDATIITELEMTYDSLYQHKALLEKVTHYHNMLTDAVLQQKDFQTILKTAYDILGRPIYLTNVHGQFMYAYGVSEERVALFQGRATFFKQLQKTANARIQQIELISTPIYLDNKMYATVSFIYDDAKGCKDDILFLERLAVAASLYFLNDKVRFETAERLKFSFLDRLIHEQFTDEKEIFRHSQYIQPALQPPYTILSLKYELMTDAAQPVDFYTQIFKIARVLDLYQLHGLVSLKENHLIVLLYDVPCAEKLGKVLKEIEKKNRHVMYKIGVSESFEQLKDCQVYIGQAEQAMHFPRADKIIYFRDLGLLGTIVGQLDNEQLEKVAIYELGELVTNQDKNKELLYTLYVYLKNNGHLEKTMQQLSLSIGGIKYRIQKIEKILQKDLKNALASSYLLLLIECLLVLHKVQFTAPA